MHWTAPTLLAIDQPEVPGILTHARLVLAFADVLYSYVERPLLVRATVHLDLTDIS